MRSMVYQVCQIPLHQSNDNVTYHADRINHPGSLSLLIHLVYGSP